MVMRTPLASCSNRFTHSRILWHRTTMSILLLQTYYCNTTPGKSDGGPILIGDITVKYRESLDACPLYVLYKFRQRSIHREDKNVHTSLLSLSSLKATCTAANSCITFSLSRACSFSSPRPPSLPPSVPEELTFSGDSHILLHNTRDTFDL